MPAGQDIQRYLLAAWRLMTGRADALKQFDTSVEGFWDSFYAIVVAAPALAIGWVTSANDIYSLAPETSRFSLVVRMAFLDLAVWVLPIVAFALVAKRAGLADRFVAYVVSSNWASVVLIWMMLPPSLLRLFAPGAADAASTASLVLFIASLVLSWRQTNGAIGKGAAVATAVFAGMFVASLVVLLTLQSLFGLYTSDGMPA